LIEIRDEQSGDEAAIREVHRRAFGGDEESRIVDALRASGGALVSLVAALNGRVVGHILYSPACVGPDAMGAALGPMAVVPEHQRQGIGTRLVEVGIERLRAAGCPFIVVVGHAHYYPRFGFRPAAAHDITCEWDVPADVFMILMLDPVRMAGISGLARYRPEFSSVP
jgi:putative acetyltransferase